MATPRRTQKQIAERYKGNLTYYKVRHPWRVARIYASIIALVGGIVALIAYQRAIFQGLASEEFFNSGEISSHHRALPKGCASCHNKDAALGGDYSLANFKQVIKSRFQHGLDFKSIDQRCQECHEKEHQPFGMKKEYDEHEPNVVDKRACSICHMEHIGPEPMKKVADVQCASCHNDRGIMEASAKKGATLPREVFHLRAHPPQQIVFERPRPAAGYTQVFASFHEEPAKGGHPEFQLIRDQAPDPSTLRFNHLLHFKDAIPLVGKDQKLDCKYCHKPDPQGRFYQRVNFKAHCQACHALLFDERNPKLHIPHGEVKLARTFLRTLPAQYAELAREQNEADVQGFIARQMRGLRQDYRTDYQVELAVFFEKNPYKPEWPRPKPEAAMTRAKFSGCAVCHEVKREPRDVITVTAPYMVDRWMPRAHFNHAKHESVECATCHRVLESEKTSDVLMPVKQDCVACHSPQTRKVSSDCITCHTYHEPGQPVKVDVRADAGAGSFKEMLLGKR